MTIQKLALCAAITLLLFATSCTTPMAPDLAAAEKAIRDADADWAKASAAKDVEAVVSYYSDDAQVLPPNAPLMVGKKPIREVWTSMLVPTMNTTWEATKVEVAQSGELGYLLGTYRMVTTDAKGQSAIDTGKILEIWKKQADGKWKCIVDTFNSDLPVTAPVVVGKKK